MILSGMTLIAGLACANIVAAGVFLVLGQLVQQALPAAAATSVITWMLIMVAAIAAALTFLRGYVAAVQGVTARAARRRLGAEQ